ncbi:site-specific tyrosine recombinase XerC [compost metagenome]
MRIQFAKSPSKQGAAFLPISFGHVVDRYIQEAGLSANDYLFPSEKDATLPMSSREMSRMIHSYLRQALADPEKRSTHQLRRSVIANAMKTGATSVSNMMGHSSLNSTLIYVRGGKKKPKE